MPSKAVTFEELTPGFEFNPAVCTLGLRTIATYLKAVGDSSEGGGSYTAVPPAAVAALVMRSLMDQLILSPGSVHLSQELEFLRPVRVGETVISHASVSKKQERTGLNMVTFDINVFNSIGEKVMVGRMLVGVMEKKA